MNLAPLALLLAGLALWRWWTTTGSPASPARLAAEQTPNATRNSEDIRDREQSVNAGQAVASPILMRMPALDDPANRF